MQFQFTKIYLRFKAVMYERYYFCTNGKGKKLLNRHFNFGDISPIKYFSYFGLFLVIIFSSIGESNDQHHILTVLMQWSIQVFVPLFFLIYIHVSLQTFTKFDLLNPWLKLVIAGCLGALLFSPFAFYIDVFLGDDSQPSSWLEWIEGIFDELSNIILPITASWVAMNAPWVLGLGFIQSIDETKNEGIETLLLDQGNQSHSEIQITYIKNTFFDIPFDEIYYLKSEQHYLRIVSVNQSKLVLFNLKDAISKFPNNFGLQVHRSYWVALNHVISIKNKQGQYWVMLPNNIFIPISRRNLSKVKLIIKD